MVPKTLTFQKAPTSPAALRDHKHAGRSVEPQPPAPPRSFPSVLHAGPSDGLDRAYLPGYFTDLGRSEPPRPAGTGRPARESKHAETHAPGLTARRPWVGDPVNLSLKKIYANLAGYLRRCSEAGYTLQEKTVRRHLQLKGYKFVAKEKQKPKGPVKFQEQVETVDKIRVHQRDQIKNKDRFLDPSISLVKTAITAAKSRSRSPVRRLALAPRTLPGVPPEPTSAAPAASAAGVHHASRALRLNVDAGPRIYKMQTERLAGGRTRDTTVQVPGVFCDEFFSHIGLTKNLEEGTGHVRVSHEFNAFPRTWSLEKIAHVVIDIARAREGLMFEADSSGKFEVNGSYHGLDIGFFCRQVGDREVVVRTAFVKETSSAGAYENREVDKANALLRRLSHPALALLVLRHLKPDHIWCTLAIAEEAIAAARSLKLRLNSQDKDLLMELHATLCLGGARHPAHRQAIDRYKAKWRPWDGVPVR